MFFAIFYANKLFYETVFWAGPWFFFCTPLKGLLLMMFPSPTPTQLYQGPGRLHGTYQKNILTLILLPPPIPTDTRISLFVFAFFAKVCNVNFGGFTWNKPKQTISFFCLKEPLLPLQWELKITKNPIFSNSISFSILLQYLTEPSAFLETVIYLPSLPVNNSQSCQTRTNPASNILYPL